MARTAGRGDAAGPAAGVAWPGGGETPLSGCGPRAGVAPASTGRVGDDPAYQGAVPGQAVAPSSTGRVVGEDPAYQVRSPGRRWRRPRPAVWWGKTPLIRCGPRAGGGAVLDRPCGGGRPRLSGCGPQVGSAVGSLSYRPPDRAPESARPRRSMASKRSEGPQFAWSESGAPPDTFAGWSQRTGSGIGPATGTAVAYGSEVDFPVLGPVRASRGMSRSVWGVRDQRTVLAVLIAEAGRTVSGRLAGGGGVGGGGHRRVPEHPPDPYLQSAGPTG